MSRTPQSVFDAIAAQRARRIAEQLAEHLIEHQDDVGAESAEREHTVSGLLRGMSGHGDGCDCDGCVELAIDEIIASRIHRGRW